MLELPSKPCFIRLTYAEHSFLAEQMLPDGAHLREEDWTVFFLNCKRPTSSEVTRDTSKDATNSNNATAEDKPLLYVLNLVRTKHDAQVRR
jgi:hypothetical protein